MCPVEGEPTMEEIVERAARDATGRGLGAALHRGRRPPGDQRTWHGLARRRERRRQLSVRPGGAAERDGWARPISADLRDDDIEQLLAENAHLNEHVVFLLKVIEGEQAQNSVGRGPKHAEIETDRGTG